MKFQFFGIIFEFRELVRHKSVLGICDDSDKSAFEVALKKSLTKMSQK